MQSTRTAKAKCRIILTKCTGSSRYMRTNFCRVSSNFIPSTRPQSPSIFQNEAKRTLSTSSKPTSIQRSDQDHCIDLVQTRDREGYMIGLLQPAYARHDYFVLRAFNAELASIKGSSIANSKDTGEVSLGTRLRMQWWRDAVGNVYQMEEDGITTDASLSHTDMQGSVQFLESAMHNPVIRALQTAIHKRKLTRRFLERLVDARMDDLEVTQFDTMHELIRYSERTLSSLYYLQLEAAGVMEETADVVASHVGIGVGLTNTLRSLLPRAGIHGEISLPRDLVIQHLVNIQLLKHPPEMEDLESAGNLAAREGIQKAVKEVANVASGHFRLARQGQIQVPKQARAVLLPAVPAMDYLNTLERVDYNIFHPDLNSDDSLQGNLAKLRGTFLLGRAALTGIF